MNKKGKLENEDCNTERESSLGLSFWTLARPSKPAAWAACFFLESGPLQAIEVCGCRAFQNTQKHTHR